MPRKPATEEQRRAIRTRLQQAAAAIYRAEGLAGISARAIAQKADVSVGTIYAHFGSLQALMQTLWQEPLERLNQRFLLAAEANPDPFARLQALLETYLDYALEFPELYRGAFLFVRPEQMEKPERLSFEDVHFPRLVRLALEQAQANGAIKGGDTEAQMQLLWAGLHGVLALPVNMDRFAFAPVRDRAETMIQTLLAQLARAAE